ncbi:hypothetical protein KIPB_002685 [Kipferlia bialata]|uniref:Uncharacterized protein n=1 Tax=Kipferlia bialata TaxID=797122 RepID=A0A9K3GGE2_9EUKA|nr:hypothetical protein KIPB_002685 [Kipferlia bialata]|eukprot:g2685.t1
MAKEGEGDSIPPKRKSRKPVEPPRGTVHYDTSMFDGYLSRVQDGTAIRLKTDAEEAERAFHVQYMIHAEAHRKTMAAFLNLHLGDPAVTQPVYSDSEGDSDSEALSVPQPEVLDSETESMYRYDTPGRDTDSECTEGDCTQDNDNRERMGFVQLPEGTEIPDVFFQYMDKGALCSIDNCSPPSIKGCDLFFRAVNKAVQEVKGDLIAPHAHLEWSMGGDCAMWKGPHALGVHTQTEATWVTKASLLQCALLFDRKAMKRRLTPQLGYVCNVPWPEVLKREQTPLPWTSPHKGMPAQSLSEAGAGTPVQQVHPPATAPGKRRRSRSDRGAEGLAGVSPSPKRLPVVRAPHKRGESSQKAQTVTTEREREEPSRKHSHRREISRKESKSKRSKRRDRSDDGDSETDCVEPMFRRVRERERLHARTVQVPKRKSVPLTSQGGGRVLRTKASRKRRRNRRPLPDLTGDETTFPTYPEDSEEV